MHNMDRPLKSLLHLSILALLGISTTYADDRDDDDVVGSISLEALLNVEVTTASRSAERATTAPGTIVVIPQSLIQRRGYRHLSDVLRDLPGIDSQGPSEPVYYNRFTVRGIQGNNKFVILQNGIRISSPTGEAVPISYNFPLYAVKQVEVVYGPASALYGADAFTGVINLITYQQNDKPASFAQARLGDFGLKYADFFSRINISDKANLSVGGHKQEADNENLSDRYPDLFPGADLIVFHDPAQPPPPPAVAAQDRQNSKLGAFPTKSDSLYANLAVDDNFHMGFNYASFQHSTALGYLDFITDFNKDPWWKTNLYSLNGTHHMNLTDKLGSDAQLSYNRYEVDPGTTFANIYVDFQSAYKYSYGDEFELGQQFYYQFSDKTQLITGYVWQHFHSIPKSADLPKRYDPDQSPGSQDLTYINTDLPIKIFDLDYHSYGGFVQLKHQFSDQLTTVAGLRYDKSSTYGSTQNPRAGLVYSANDKMTFKLLYGEAFLAPSPKDAYEHYGGFAPKDQNDTGPYQSGFFHIANPDLQPETIKTLELNGNFRLGGNLNLTATVYEEKAEKIIAQVASNPQQPDFVPGGHIAYTQTNDNVGTIDAHGLDIGIIGQINFAQISLQPWLNASWVDGQLDGAEGKVDLPFTASKKVKAGLTLYSGNWFITPSVLWNSDMNASETGSSKGATVPGQTEVNLFAGYNNLLPGLDLSFRVNNLLDKDLYSAGDGPDQFSFVAVPQDGRSAEFSVKYRF